MNHRFFILVCLRIGALNNQAVALQIATVAIQGLGHTISLLTFCGTSAGSGWPGGCKRWAYLWNDILNNIISNPAVRVGLVS
jgi:hypothetical protein